jgi:hypothetical protein
MSDTIPQDTIEHKKCTGLCQEVKPLTDFYSYKRGTHLKYDSQCKECVSSARHASYLLKHPDPTPKVHASVPQQLQCRVCHKTKTIEEFKKDSSRRIGYARICKSCHSPISNKPDRKKTNKRKYKYNITTQQYEQMLANQNGMCAICRNPEPRTDPHTGIRRALAVDHDHKTGKIRDLLCSSCNLALGLLQDDPIRIQEMLSYLQKHTSEEDCSA